jgi:hypothetical protein
MSVYAFAVSRKELGDDSSDTALGWDQTVSNGRRPTDSASGKMVGRRSLLP